MNKQKKQIEITKQKAIELFNGLGYKTADRWNAKRLEDKIKNLPDLYDGSELKDGDGSPHKLKARLSRLLAILKKGGSIIIVDEQNPLEEGLPPEPNVEKVREHKQKRTAEKEEKEAKKMAKKSKKTSKKKAAKKSTKKAAEKKVVAKKTTKKAKSKLVKKARPPGVILSVLEFIQEHGPISAKEILAKLKKRFPNRSLESMGRTIPRIPGHLSREKNINTIKKNDKGQYYIEK